MTGFFYVSILSGRIRVIGLSKAWYNTCMNVRNSTIFLAIVSFIIVGVFVLAPGRIERNGVFAPAPVDDSSVINPTPMPETSPEEMTAPVYKDLIRVDAPLPESVVSSPLVIRGAARGNWFFEASFPVVLTDWDGRIIAEGVAQAEGEWMTADYVPFMAQLTFVPDTRVSDRGALILQKSNPSGLPEHDDALEFTVYFSR